MFQPIQCASGLLSSITPNPFRPLARRRERRLGSALQGPINFAKTVRTALAAIPGCIAAFSQISRFGVL
jgi:hypothetical protein